MRKSFYIFCSYGRPLAVVLSAVLVFSLLHTDALARAKKKLKEETPKRALKIRDYKWGGGGSGRPGILKEITIENTGKLAYETIQIEAEFYTMDDRPQGSLRTTIREVLEPGVTKTFYNLSFGIMHSPLEKTTLRVASAKTSTTGPGSMPNPGELVKVVEWKWAGGLYGTEGILEAITLNNTSEKTLKNIELAVEYWAGNIKKGYTRVFIQDIISPKGTKTFHGVNVGFRHPEATKAVISVIGVDEAKVKKKEIVRKLVRRKKTKQKGVAVGEGERPAWEEPDLGEESPTARRKRLIIQKRTREQTGPAAPPSVARAPGEIAKGAMAQGRSLEPEDEGEEYIEVEEIEVIENPIPDQDIIVRSFVMGNTIPYTIGYLDRLTLENISTITYKRIAITIDFYSRSDNRPLASSRIVIPEVIPPNSKKTFKKVMVGFLSIKPEVVVIRVEGASVVR